MGLLQTARKQPPRHQSDLHPFQGIISPKTIEYRIKDVFDHWSPKRRLLFIAKSVRCLFVSNVAIASSPHAWEYVVGTLRLHRQIGGPVYFKWQHTTFKVPKQKPLPWIRTIFLWALGPFASSRETLWFVYQYQLCMGIHRRNSEWNQVVWFFFYNSTKAITNGTTIRLWGLFETRV